MERADQARGDDDIAQLQLALPAPATPRNLSGNQQEPPIKKLFLGHPLEKVVNREAMANPECLPFYQALAQAHLARSAG